MTSWTTILDETLWIGGIAALVGWFCLCFLLANFGSWNEIARRYPASDSPHGKRFLLESARLGRTFYPACLTVHVCDEGFYLSVIAPFRPGHPPIFIPAKVIHHYRTSRRIFVRRSVFDIGWPRICTVRMRRKVVLSIEGSATGSGKPVSNAPPTRPLRSFGHP